MALLRHYTNALECLWVGKGEDETFLRCTAHWRSRHIPKRVEMIFTPFLTKPEHLDGLPGAPAVFDL